MCEVCLQDKYDSAIATITNLLSQNAGLVRDIAQLKHDNAALAKSSVTLADRAIQERKELLEALDRQEAEHEVACNRVKQLMKANKELHRDLDGMSVRVREQESEKKELRVQVSALKVKKSVMRDSLKLMDLKIKNLDKQIQRIIEAAE